MTSYFTSSTTYTYTSNVLNVIKFGPSSGHEYRLSTIIDDSSNSYTLCERINSNSETIWAKVYQVESVTRAFEVDTSEVGL